ncbi:MAG: sulfotransferase family protein, partial [Bacteroidales bacterium]|nr:sulfotransferase family protein [Bacteroidales bacterium]
KSDNSWLHEAEGKAVKVVSTLLDSLPDQFDYKVLFMYRNMAEIIESQNQMLAREGKQPAVDSERLAFFFSNHLQKVERWLGEQQNYSCCPISFNALFTEEVWDDIKKIDSFLGGNFNQEAMLAVIDNALYRKRMVTDATR